MDKQLAAFFLNYSGSSELVIQHGPKRPVTVWVQYVEDDPIRGQGEWQWARLGYCGSEASAIKQIRELGWRGSFMVEPYRPPEPEPMPASTSALINIEHRTLN